MVRVSTYTYFSSCRYLANGCELPIKDWLFLDYTVSCLSNKRQKECQNTEQGSLVPEFTSLILNCSEGFVSNTSNEVVCFRSKWSPPVEPCRSKLLSRLNPVWRYIPNGMNWVNRCQDKVVNMTLRGASLPPRTYAEMNSVYSIRELGLIYRSCSVFMNTLRCV